MTAVDHEYESEKKEYKRTIGDFDGWVQDEQEKAAIRKYEAYVQNHQFKEMPMTFDEWCVDQPNRRK